MRNVELMQKRIASYGEFDNGHILHEWSEMTCKEAEKLAWQKSLENPNDVFYVAYNDLIDTCSDTRWINGKAYHWTDIVCKNSRYCVEG